MMNMELKVMKLQTKEALQVLGVKILFDLFRVCFRSSFRMKMMNTELKVIMELMLKMMNMELKVMKLQTKEALQVLGVKILFDLFRVWFRSSFRMKMMNMELKVIMELKVMKMQARLHLWQKILE